MYNGTNSEAYGSAAALQSRSSGYSPYGNSTQASHLQPKDMVSIKGVENSTDFSDFFGFLRFDGFQRLKNSREISKIEKN